MESPRPGAAAGWWVRRVVLCSGVYGNGAVLPLLFVSRVLTATAGLAAVSADGDFTEPVPHQKWPSSAVLSESLLHHTRSSHYPQARGAGAQHQDPSDAPQGH